MNDIEIDGVKEAVWRCRALVSWRTAGIFPFCGGDLSEWLRTDPPAPGRWPRDHQLEILLTEEVLHCSTDQPVEAPEVVAIDTAAGTVTMKSGAVVAAKIARREHLGDEARVVREERMIAALTQAKDLKDRKDAKGERKHARTRTRTRRRAKKLVCGVCGWGHDAGFTRIEIPGRRVIALHGLMAQIVGLVHEAQASGAGAVSTKDEKLLALCGGYRHPCKVFDDLKRRADYKVLFDTKRRGLLGLKINVEACSPTCPRPAWENTA